MQQFSYPAMPMYTQDHAAYIRQMHEWHTHMAKHYEAKQKYHEERARHFQNLIGGNIVIMERPNGAAS